MTSRAGTVWAGLVLVAALLSSLAVSAERFDTPEDAVRALERAYVQENADAVVAALDFLEGGRQMLQETNPLLADDPETIKRTAEVLEQSFRNEWRTKGFPDFAGLQCSFVGKAQIAPELIKLSEQCVSRAGGKSIRDLIVKKRDLEWRVVAVAPVF